MNFETAERPACNKYFDWECIKNFGKLPLFTASGAALIFIPIFFYLIDVYNSHLEALKSGLVVYVNNDALGNLLRGLSAIITLRKQRPVVESQRQAGDTQLRITQKMIDAGLVVFEARSGGFESMSLLEIGLAFPDALQAAFSCIHEAQEKTPKCPG